MVKTRIIFLFAVVLVVFLFLPLRIYAGMPSVNEISVSDVTTRSFSVAWLTSASEPSTGTLNVYSAPDCTAEVGGIVVNSRGADTTGVIQVTVTGLIPDTAYCYQTVTTSRSTSETTIAPIPPGIVTTERQTVRTYTQGTEILPFSNDLLYHPVFRFDGTAGAGGVLMVSVDGGSYPVSAWVGDNGILAPHTLIDLNNLFRADTRENINLAGGERINMLELRGSNGCTLERWRKVPVDMELSEVRVPQSCFDSADINCDDIVEIGDIIMDINGFGSLSGDFCFNSDLDQDGDGVVDIGDIILVIGKFGLMK